MYCEIAMPSLVTNPSAVPTSQLGRLSGRDIVCFSHDWTGDPLSKTHFMRLLARRNRVLWVNSIGYRRPQATAADLSRAWRKLSAACKPLTEVEPNLYVLNPLIVPAHGVPAIRWLNRWWLRRQVLRAMRELSFQQAINWTFNPAAAMIAGSLGEATLIYHCVDEYSAFTGVSAEAIQSLERQLLSKADLVIVSAESLRESKRVIRPDIELVRHGVDYEHFRTALDSATEVPADIATLPRPIFGFFGLVADWVDQDLLLQVAKRYPHGSIVLLGKVTTDVSRLRLPNIHLLGRREYQALPAYCKGFDVALNPFVINRLTLHFNPLKVREYLAAGLSVVSTNLPEVALLDHCYVADSHEGFARQLETALQRPGPQRAISETMRAESWDNRLLDIEQHFFQLQTEG
jgi:glycosyltransferase involved in cell wall biosynthesis